MGRPLKLTADLQAKLVQALALGSTRRAACEYAGIGEATLREWLTRRGAVYSALAAAIKEAEAKSTIGALAKIQKAATDGQWQAAAWLLERRHPEEYGRRQVVALARAAEPVEPEALAAAAAQGVGSADAAVLFRRQLAVLESARVAGRITDREYLAGMDRLTAQATRLAELSARTQAPGAGAPRVELVLKLDSEGIDAPAALPDGVEPARRAAGGGDLIEVG
jgi:hypothetical protein